MKSAHKLALGLAGGLLTAALLMGGALWLGGVRHVYFEHVVATLEIAGLASSREAAELERRLHGLRGMRDISLACTSLSGETWMARLQFHARNPEEAARQVEDWIKAFPAAQSARLIRATFYDCRLARPGRGDIVVGKPRPIPFAR